MRCIFPHVLSFYVYCCSIKFEGEEAIDMGGVKKEFFNLFMRSYIKQNDIFEACGGYDSDSDGTANAIWFRRCNGSTEKTLDASEVQENKRHKVEPFSYSQEYLIGVMLGLAFYHNVLVSFPIPVHLYKLLKHSKLSLDDLWAIEPDLAKSLQYLLEYEDSIQSDIGTTFVSSKNPLLQGHHIGEDSEDIELKQGGSNIFVNKANRADFVNLFVHYALYGSCRNAIDEFIKGWREIIDSAAMNMATDVELESLTCGSIDITEFAKLREYTRYDGEFSDQHPIIQWFWDILSTFSVKEQRKFLEFVTGSQHIPIGGIEKVGLIIQSTMQPETCLPTAHTCFNTLVLPLSYSSRGMLEERLLSAIENSQGFGFL